jgi:hypothetical protein
MAVKLRRAAFGFFWFGVFWIALLTIAGGISGATTAKIPSRQTSVQPGSQHSPQPDVAAGVEFRERHGTWIIIGAAALATIGTVTGVLPGTRRN